MLVAIVPLVACASAALPPLTASHPASPAGPEPPTAPEPRPDSPPHGAPGHDHGPHGAPTPSGVAVYECPMHPEVTANEPGNCPKCGMTLRLKP
jgi:hypothetical protein